MGTVKHDGLKQIGFRLRLLRYAQSMTQKELAERCGVHRSYIGAMERGEQNINTKMLVRLLDELNASLESLFEKPKRNLP